MKRKWYHADQRIKELESEVAFLREHMRMTAEQDNQYINMLRERVEELRKRLGEK